MPELYADPTEPAIRLLRTLADCPPHAEFEAQALTDASVALLKEIGRWKVLESMASQVRRAQRRYFATRTDEDLIFSRELEVQLDRVLKGVSPEEAKRWPT